MVTLPRQRGVMAAKLANMKRGQRTDIEPSANLQNVSQASAAEMLNVSTRTVASAQKVIDEAPQEVVQAVERGAMSVSLAAKVAALLDAAPARPFVFLPASMAGRKGLGLWSRLQAPAAKQHQYPVTLV